MQKGLNPRNRVCPPTQRSWNMSRIKAEDTQPEMIVRRLVHSMGYRYRLHRKDLPGTPDIVFPSRRKLILIHGCYWHVHLHYDPICRRAKAQKSNGEYWGDKLKRNLDRDAKNLKALQEAGWKTLLLRECGMKNRARLGDRISDFLEFA